jgi:methylmalonyl-CoA/ethylmalonyl-CoA epimerase
MKFDHVGIIVSDLPSGRDHFTSVYGIKEWSKEFCDEINGVYVQFCIDSTGICYEIIAPIDKNSPVYNVIEKSLNIINHIAYRVENIEEKALDLYDNNFISLGEAKKAVAYKMKKIQFFYSKDHHYLLELIESSNHKHEYSKLDR